MSEPLTIHPSRYRVIAPSAAGNLMGDYPTLAGARKAAGATGRIFAVLDRADGGFNLMLIPADGTDDNGRDVSERADGGAVGSVCSYCLTRPSAGMTEDNDTICDECAEPLPPRDDARVALAALRERIEALILTADKYGTVTKTEVRALLATGACGTCGGSGNVKVGHGDDDADRCPDCNPAPVVVPRRDGGYIRPAYSTDETEET